MSSANSTYQLHLFEAVGVELEYMIVDRETLNVRPIADQLIYDVRGAYVNDVDNGIITWSNELVLHVIELKTTRPVCLHPELHLEFQQQVRMINQLLEGHNAMLMPSAMHPWMDPYVEMELWPHEYNPIFEAFHRIFDCRGHGWANLQSTHINLPFANDDEFERLHAAIRVLLPVLPGLTASSPVANGRRTSFYDYRMEVYRKNSAKIPSVTGLVVPEPLFSKMEYEQGILQPMFRDIAPHDPDKILQLEWLNSRGAIARFDRGSIEIRVLDIQECPMADLAVIRFIVDTLRALVEGDFCSLDVQKKWGEEPLSEILFRVIKEGEYAKIERDYLQLFGIRGDKPITVAELWRSVFLQLYSEKERETDSQLKVLQQILDTGTLSTRILNSLPEQLGRSDLLQIYGSLCRNLDSGEIYIGRR